MKKTKKITLFNFLRVLVVIVPVLVLTGCPTSGDSGSKRYTVTFDTDGGTSIEARRYQRTVL